MDAQAQHLPLATLIVLVLYKYKAQRKTEADLFIPPQLREAGQEPGVPIYTQPSDPRLPEQASKLHAPSGSER